MAAFFRFWAVLVISQVAGCRSASSSHVAEAVAPAPVSPPCLPAAPLEPPSWMGTAHPILPVASSTSRRWAVYCQARVDTDGDGRIALSFGRHGEPFGDDLVPYLAWGEDFETRIDELVAGDPTGRWVAVVVDQQLALLDALTGRWTRLHGDVFTGGNVGPHRAARFSAEGSKLLYLAKDSTQVVVRDLCSATESVIDLEDDAVVVVAAEFTADGKDVAVSALVDRNGDGAVTFPVLDGTGPGRSCRRPSGRPLIGYRTHDEHTIRVAPVTGGLARIVETAPELVPEPPKGAPLEAARTPLDGPRFGPLTWSSP